MSDQEKLSSNNRKLKKSGIKSIFRTFLHLFLQAVLFFIIYFVLTRTAIAPTALLYYGIQLGTTIATILILYLANPELVNLRGDTAMEGSKSWDKVLLITWVVLLYILSIIAALDLGFFRFVTFIPSLIIIGVTLWIVATILGIWALVVNTHFETTVRIQKDRDHQVISTGPYSVVRHPGYLASLIAYIAIPLILNSFFTFIPAGIIITLFILRTYKEDKTLQEELNGYAEYTEKVKYRLVPGIW